MAQQTINLGAVANDGTGDPLRIGGQKINENFTELYALWNRASGTISSGSIQGCGTSAVQILPAAGANKYYSNILLSISYKAGITAFNFTDSLVFKTNGGDGQFYISVDDINTTVSFNADLPKQGGKQATNAAFIMTTLDGLNATLGNGDFDYVIYYTIENTNT